MNIYTSDVIGYIVRLLGFKLNRVGTYNIMLHITSE